jgi:hypothetical protein
MQSIDPWGPGPKRPDASDTSESESGQEATAQQTPGATPRDSHEKREEPALEKSPVKQENNVKREESAHTPAPPARALTRPQPQPGRPGAFTRIIGAARVVLPVVQKMLPLLEGNVVSTAANLLTPSPRPVDLEPVKGAIGKLQAEHRTLRGQVADQRASLNSIESELSTIRDGLDRNTSEIRELAEAQLNLQRRLTRLAWMLFILLTLSIAFTALISIRLAYILRL